MNLLKKIRLTLSFICVSLTVKSQNCGPGNVTLTSQAQVDNFVATYSGTCNTINGNLTITSNPLLTDISSLTGLQNATSINNLTIQNENAITDLTGINTQTCFSENYSIGSLTYVPDDNFEQALIDLGYDSGSLDDYVPTDNINTIVSLNVDNKNIADLTGIEDFIALTSLVCRNNYLTTIDLSNNINLTLLNLFNNSIINLDLTSTTVLDNLNFVSNAVTTINLSNNTLLTTLRCNNNQLTSLNLENNTALTFLNSSTNILTSLNIKNSNNVNITFFKADNNSDLTCIEVDDANYSTNNWTNIDVQTSFNEDCSALSVGSFNNPKMQIYPNPTSKIITIDYQFDIFKIEFYDFLGKLAMQKQLSHNINISNLSNGIYLVKIYTERGVVTKKVVKK